ncbi:hypothetical protein MPC1_3830001 [Methylocella tundrae]|nr:hypothetical protein MPC1_3830001 [Methylocella tundrae]
MSWAYASIPSVQEILVVRTAGIGADHPLRRNRDGSWPDRALAIGELKLESGGLGRLSPPLIAPCGWRRIVKQDRRAGPRHNANAVQRGKPAIFFSLSVVSFRPFRRHDIYDGCRRDRRSVSDTTYEDRPWCRRRSGTPRDCETIYGWRG